jgi:pilus assembly protein Flp/PilA
VLAKEGLTMLGICRKCRKDEDGATAIEYGLIAGLISVVIVTAIMTVESSLSNVFTYISSNVDYAL